MSHVVDFQNVSTKGLESSPVAETLAGLRANEARYFKNKYDSDLTIEPATEAATTVEWVRGILKDERDIVIAAVPLEATEFVVAGKRGLAIHGCPSRSITFQPLRARERHSGALMAAGGGCASQDR